MKTLQELKAMSDDELRVMLAVLTGWECCKKIPETGGLITGFHHKHDTFTKIIPDYPQDLNACHDVEGALTLDQSTAYVNALWPQGYAPFQAVHATARQRTIFLILTLQPQ